MPNKPLNRHIMRASPRPESANFAGFPHSEPSREVLLGNDGGRRVVRFFLNGEKARPAKWLALFFALLFSAFFAPNKPTAAESSANMIRVGLQSNLLAVFFQKRVGSVRQT
jgi:hypothetical protein